MQRPRDLGIARHPSFERAEQSSGLVRTMLERSEPRPKSSQHYCRAGCESSRPFGFQGTPPRSLGGVFAFWPTFRRDRESHQSRAASLPRGMFISGSGPIARHGRDFGPKSLRVSRCRGPGLTGLRARVGMRDNPSPAKSGRPCRGSRPRPRPTRGWMERGGRAARSVVRRAPHDGAGKVR